jgi:hypothetical protein
VYASFFSLYYVHGGSTKVTNIEVQEKLHELLSLLKNMEDLTKKVNDDDEIIFYLCDESREKLLWTFDCIRDSTIYIEAIIRLDGFEKRNI